MGLINETERSRTSDLQIRNLTLYPTELQSQKYYTVRCETLKQDVILLGAGGIRTPDILVGYNSLAGSHLRPLGHHSKFCQMAKMPYLYSEQGGFEPPDP